MGPALGGSATATGRNDSELENLVGEEEAREGARSRQEKGDKKRSQSFSFVVGVATAAAVPASFFLKKDQNGGSRASKATPLMTGGDRMESGGSGGGGDGVREVNDGDDNDDVVVVVPAIVQNRFQKMKKQPRCLDGNPNFSTHIELERGSPSLGWGKFSKACRFDRKGAQRVVEAEFRSAAQRRRKTATANSTPARCLRFLLSTTRARLFKFASPGSSFTVYVKNSPERSKESSRETGRECDVYAASVAALGLKKRGEKEVPFFFN